MYLSSICFRCSLFPVCNWRQTVRIYCRDTFRVVISKRVSPDDRLDFLNSQFCRIKLIQLFFFQRRKPALHPCIIPAFPDTAHTLNSVQLSEYLFVFIARIRQDFFCLHAADFPVPLHGIVNSSAVPKYPKCI